MSIAIEPPRPLTQPERDIVTAMLSVDFPGAAELRSQVDRARVVAQWGANSPSVDIEVPADATSAAIANGPVPIDSTVFDQAGNVIGEILLWTGSGKLSGIEYAWYTDNPPTELPLLQQLTVQPRN